MVARRGQYALPMADALALAVYAGAIGTGAALVWRRPLWALYAFVVGLALHNVVLAALKGGKAA